MTDYFNNVNRDFESSYKVIKLGGTSQCKIGYDRLIGSIKRNLNKTYFIVLSAVSGVTNNLVKFIETKNNTYIDKVIEINYKLIGELNLDINESNLTPIFDKLIDISQEYITSYDMNDTYKKSEIIGYGEILSTNIFYAYIDSDSDFTFRSLTLYNSYNHIKSKKEIYQCDSSVEFYFDILNSEIDDINIFQGFIGSTPSGKKILLGRGGSDTTGSLIAARLNASSYEVWTDVNGIYTADPINK